MIRSFISCYVTYQFSDPVKNKINDFLSNSVVPASIVVGSILFASYQLFWVKQLSVGASTNLIWNSQNIQYLCFETMTPCTLHVLILESDLVLTEQCLFQWKQWGYMIVWTTKCNFEICYVVDNDAGKVSPAPRQSYLQKNEIHHSIKNCYFFNSFKYFLLNRTNKHISLPHAQEMFQNQLCLKYFFLCCAS